MALRLHPQYGWSADYRFAHWSPPDRLQHYMEVYTDYDVWTKWMVTDNYGNCVDSEAHPYGIYFAWEELLQEGVKL